MAYMHIEVTDDEIDPQQLADLVDELRSEMFSLPVDDVSLAQEPAPAGTRGATRDLAMVIVQFVLESGLVKVLTEHVRRWSSRHRVAEVKIVVGDATLVLAKATEAQQQELINQFIAAIGERAAQA